MKVLTEVRYRCRRQKRKEQLTGLAGVICSLTLWVQPHTTRILASELSKTSSLAAKYIMRVLEEPMPAQILTADRLERSQGATHTSHHHKHTKSRDHDTSALFIGITRCTRICPRINPRVLCELTDGFTTNLPLTTMTIR